MAKTIDYLKKYLQIEKEKKIPNYKALEDIGLQGASMGMYKTGSIPNDEPLVKLAKKLNIEPCEILTLAASERAKNKETKKEWLKLYNEIIKNKPISQRIASSKEIILEIRE